MSSYKDYRKLLQELRDGLSFDEFQGVFVNKIIDFLQRNKGISFEAAKAELGKIMGKAYSPMVDEAIKQFADLRKGVNEIYQGLGDDVSADKLTAIKRVTEIKYGAFHQDALRGMNRIISNAIANGLDINELRNKLNGLGGRVGAYSNVIADTQYSAAGQTMKNFKADLAGIEKFEYVGNLRVTSRLFCQKHLGKIYTRDEIKALDGDPDLGRAGIKPVMVYKGGWNCAHDWEPAG